MTDLQPISTTAVPSRARLPSGRCFQGFVRQPPFVFFDGDRAARELTSDQSFFELFQVRPAAAQWCSHHARGIKWSNDQLSAPRRIGTQESGKSWRNSAPWSLALFINSGR